MILNVFLCYMTLKGARLLEQHSSVYDESGMSHNE